jgi:anhydro-N-acetylmuramic acid kinase
VRLGMDYDKGGNIARSGNIDTGLLNELNSLSYYTQKYPKSLGREWLETEFLPLIDNKSLPVKDLLRTICEHAALQINKSIRQDKSLNILVTGGGAHHKFLMERIRLTGHQQWIIPQKELTDFKEALVFAFLGVLRWKNETNVFRSVTGSRADHSGGAIYNPV